jgi:DNA-binding NarL/FixJ family response regulator
MFRNELRELVDAEANLKVVGEVSDGISLLSSIKENKPDLVVMDPSMFGFRGIEMVREIKTLKKNLRILVVTMNTEAENLYQCVFNGAESYLVKEDAQQELLAAVKKIRKGGFYFSKQLQDNLTKEFKAIYRGDGRYPTVRLTPRENEVLKLIAEGNSNNKIAKRLGISVRTAEQHRAKLYKKFSTNKVVKLVKYAIQTGMVSLYDD